MEKEGGAGRGGKERGMGNTGEKQGGRGRKWETREG